MQRQPQRLAGFGDLSGHRKVRVRGRGVTRGMIVDKDEGACVQFQCPLDDFARVDRDVIDGALGLFLIRDQHVFSIKEKHAKLLSLTM